MFDRRQYSSDNKLWNDGSQDFQSLFVWGMTINNLFQICSVPLLAYLTEPTRTRILKSNNQEHRGKFFEITLTTRHMHIFRHSNDAII